MSAGTAYGQVLLKIWYAAERWLYGRQTLENQDSIVRAEHFWKCSLQNCCRWPGALSTGTDHSIEGSKQDQAHGIWRTRGRQSVTKDRLSGAAAVPTGTFGMLGYCAVSDPGTELLFLYLCLQFVDYHGQPYIFELYISAWNHASYWLRRSKNSELTTATWDHSKSAQRGPRCNLDILIPEEKKIYLIPKFSRLTKTYSSLPFYFWDSVLITSALPPPTWILR